MKKILTSNGKILTENGKILTANVESGGGLIEVTELPEVGEENTVYKLASKPTQVPNSGYVEKVYFNTSLSVEEVDNILSNINYINYNGGYRYGVIAFGDNYGIFITYYNQDNDYYITYGKLGDYGSGELIYTSINGWYDKASYEINATTFTETLATQLGQIMQNDKLVNVISITPFEEEKIPSEMYYLYKENEWVQISGGILEVDNLPTSGEDNYVYALKKQPTYDVYVNEKEQGISNLTELAKQYGGKVEVVAVVNILPTENIIVSPSDMEMNLYYIKNDGLYVYADSTGDGNVTWHNFADAMVLSFSGEVTSESDMTVTDSLYLLSSGGDSANYYIYEKGEPTQVPNIGWIENLYFNTKLSIEEVDNILSQLTYDTNGHAYVVGGYEKGSSYGNIIIVEANAFTQGQIPSGYIIGHMHDTTNMASTEFIYMSNQGLVDLALTLGINTKVGWNMETLNLNQTFIGHYGTENDKLINVISTTPYPHWSEISGGATVKATPEVVPNTGFVEKVYLNKSLSFDEVNAICTKANSLVANELPPIYGVVSNNTFDKQIIIMKLTDQDGTTFNSIHYPNLANVIWSERDYYNEETDGSITQFKKGWMFEKDYVEIDSEVVSVIEGDFAINVGQHNNQLTELFSINNVFKTEEIELTESYDGSSLVLSNKYVKKTVVPNEGYVERVYLNTALSIDEVKAILEKFYTYYDGDNIDNMIWLINIDDFNNSSVTPEKLHWIMSSRDSGDYAIVNALSQIIFKSDSSKWIGGDFVGWNPEFITAEKPYLEINSQVFPIVTENGKETKVGGFNDKLVDLFSLTPFEETIYDSVEVDIKEMLEEKKLPLSVKVNIVSTNIVSQDGEIIKTLGGDYEAVDLEFNEPPSFWQETVFVNGNYVEKLYFNTELTTDEIDAIFSTLTYDYNSHLITQYATAEAGRFGSIYIIKMETNGLNGYTIRISNFDGDSYIYASNQEIADYIKSNYNKSVEVGLNITEFPINNTIHTVSNEISNLTNLISSKPPLKNTINVESYLDNKQMPLSVKVNVEPNLQEKEITENGEYVADEGYDGFSKVTVNVAGEDMLQARVDATNSCEYLFYQYKGDNVDFIKDLDTSNVTNMSSMFNGCSMLKTIPQLDTSNVTDMISMFRDCSALETIPQLDMIKSTNRSQMFYNCSKLTNLTLLNIKAYIDLSQNEKLTLESLINTVKEFINVGSARILTMGTANLEKIASTYVKFTDSSVTIPTNEKGDVVVCESTDEGAMLLKDYALLKNWTLA